MNARTGFHVYRPGDAVWNRKHGFGHVEEAGPEPDGYFVDFGNGCPILMLADMIRPARHGRHVGEELVRAGTELYCIVIGFDGDEGVRVQWMSGDKTVENLDDLETPLLSRDDRANVHDPIGFGGDPGAHLTGRAAELFERVLEFSDAKPRLARNYLVKGWLNAGAFSVVFGEPKAGKSFVALDLSAHVAASRNWHGFRVPQDGAGWAFYCALEGGAGFENRLAALRLGRPELAEVIDPEKTLVTLKSGLDMHGDGDAEALLEVLSCYPSSPDLIVLDTLARAMGTGDENSAQDMGALIRNVDMIREATGAHVLLVHHSGKDRDRGARGHSSLKAAVDTEIHVTRDGDVCTAATTCQRDIPEMHEFHYTLRRVALGQDEDGDDVTSAVVEPTEAQTRKPRVKGQALVAWQALDDALAHHGARKGGDMFPSNRDCVSLETWRDYCDRHSLSGGEGESSRRTAFHKAKTALHEKEIIRIVDGFVWKVGADD